MTTLNSSLFPQLDFLLRAEEFVIWQGNLTRQRQKGSDMKPTRRAFLATLTFPLLPETNVLAAQRKRMIQTVLGKIPAESFGFAVPHEHVLCDFIGADKTNRDRWRVQDVVTKAKPYLLQLKERGVRGFVDCTPAYIGRDPRVLKLLAEQTGLHILTNTGYYGGAGDKFVPKHAYDETEEQLATRWIQEWELGIEDTGIKPGFIKIGVDEVEKESNNLTEIDAKIVRASAIASLKTGLTVTCHTGGGPAGLQAAKLFISKKGKAAKFIVAHSDGHGTPINEEVAKLGAWVSFDGIGYQTLEKHLEIVTPLVQKYPKRVLLSMDAGWYWAGEENGGKFKDYNYLCDTFLPALREKGVSQQTIQLLTVSNPASAFAL